MKVIVATVGRPAGTIAPAIREYEGRAQRYWKLVVQEVRGARASRNRPAEEVMREEGDRLLAVAPDGAEIVALTRSGEPWSSERLAEYLNALGLAGAPGAAFLIGGAFGLGEAVTRAARHRLSLSAMTMPHDIARLIFAEQLYRAGTIARGEPYHKGGIQ